MLIKPNKRSNLKKHGIKCFFGGKTNQFEKSATKRRVILLNFLEQKQTKKLYFSLGQKCSRRYAIMDGR